VRDRLQSLGATGPGAEAWALRKVLAGPRTGAMRLSLRAADGPGKVAVERGAEDAANGPPLIARRMGEARDLGYIRVRNVLGDPGLVPRFDAALHYLMDTRAVILDLRETPDGGSRIVCEALLGYFVESAATWQLREAAGRRRVPDIVKPGTTRYRGGLVVLVDRWTAGEAEALAAGLEGAARAVLVGTPMAGLHGETRALTLPHSRIVARFPAERTFHVNGTPRELIRPAVEVDLASPSGGPGDPILYQGLKTASSAPAGRSAPR
jgi:carboxyl-terminal processing protease